MRVPQLVRAELHYHYQSNLCSLTSPIPVTDYRYHLLPPTAHRSYSLRKRQHGYQLPHIEYNLQKNSFINRCLLETAIEVSSITDHYCFFTVFQKKVHPYDSPL